MILNANAIKVVLFSTSLLLCGIPIYASNRTSYNTPIPREERIALRLASVLPAATTCYYFEYDYERPRELRMHTDATVKRYGLGWQEFYSLLGDTVQIACDTAPFTVDDSVINRLLNRGIKTLVIYYNYAVYKTKLPESSGTITHVSGGGVFPGMPVSVNIQFTSSSSFLGQNSERYRYEKCLSCLIYDLTNRKIVKTFESGVRFSVDSNEDNCTHIINKLFDQFYTEFENPKYDSKTTTEVTPVNNADATKPANIFENPRRRRY